jgi:hypothetical protein
MAGDPRVGVEERYQGVSSRSRFKRPFGNAQSIILMVWTQLKQRRIAERKYAIANGLMADPDVPRSLEDAITLRGTCEDFCPEFERVTRIVQKDVWGPEMVSLHGTPT